MTARIFKPAKNAMQSGRAKTKEWQLDYEPEQPRAIEPLMGWTSSGDMKQQVTLLELVDRVLNKGVVVSGDITLSVAGVDLVYVGLRVLLSSVATLEEPRERISATGAAPLGVVNNCASAPWQTVAGCGPVAAKADCTVNCAVLVTASRHCPMTTTVTA